MHWLSAQVSPNEEPPFKWAQIKYGSAKCCTNKISADKKLQDRVVNPHISPCSVASKLCRLRSDTPHRPKEESLTCLLWLESSRRTWRPIKTRIRKVTIAWSRLKNQNVRHFHSIWRPTGAECSAIWQWHVGARVLANLKIFALTVLDPVSVYCQLHSFPII